MALFRFGHPRPALRPGQIAEIHLGRGTSRYLLIQVRCWAPKKVGEKKGTWMYAGWVLEIEDGRLRYDGYRMFEEKNLVLVAGFEPYPLRQALLACTKTASEDL